MLGSHSSDSIDQECDLDQTLALSFLLGDVDDWNGGWEDATDSTLFLPSVSIDLATISNGPDGSSAAFEDSTTAEPLFQGP
jgi:hypothetical protein